MPERILYLIVLFSLFLYFKASAQFYLTAHSWLILNMHKWTVFTVSKLSISYTGQLDKDLFFLPRRMWLPSLFPFCYYANKIPDTQNTFSKCHFPFALPDVFSARCVCYMLCNVALSWKHSSL